MDSLWNCVQVLHAAEGNIPVEFVAVDGRLWYDDPKIKRQELLDAVAGRFAVKHVEPKPSVWQGPHRLTKVDKWDKASASNTGLIHADGLAVMFTDDCTIFEDEWLLWHWRHISLGLSTAGGYKYVYAGTSNVEGGRLVAGVIQDPGDHRLRERTEVEVCPGGWMYGGNAGASLRSCIQVNGFDEIMSGQGGMEDCEFGLRISRVSPLVFIPYANILQITESHETVTEFLRSEVASARECACGHRITEHTDNSPRGCKSCACVEYVPPPQKACKGYAYKDNTGQVHHMSYNHWPIYRLMGARPMLHEDGFFRVENAPDLESEKSRFLPLGNRFSLAEYRKMVRLGMPLPIPSKPTTDWRDGQKLEDMI